MIRAKPLFPGRCSGRGVFLLGVLSAEALDAAGGVHQLLFAGEERMAARANFYADITLMGGPRHKCIAAGTVHAYFVVCGMNSCFHGPKPRFESLDSTGWGQDSATVARAR